MMDDPHPGAWKTDSWIILGLRETPSDECCKAWFLLGPRDGHPMVRCNEPMSI